MQKKLNIKRNENIEFQKGAQWFSITDGLARYVLSKDEWIKNVFKNGFCVDECIFRPQNSICTDFQTQSHGE